jgi:hypothetical protein
VNDLWMIAATLGFFAVCAAYVALCDRIVGPDEIGSPTDVSTDPKTDVATGTETGEPVAVRSGTSAGAVQR